ncbi:MAG: hypothetical protein M3N46_12915 [Actinomycetota bacterium]|nr:hypothetical protein [Actinomycetota bacterium]
MIGSQPTYLLVTEVAWTQRIGVQVPGLLTLAPDGQVTLLEKSDAHDPVTVFEASARQVRVGGSMNNPSIRVGGVTYRIDFSPSIEFPSIGVSAYRMIQSVRSAHRSDLPKWISALAQRGARMRYLSYTGTIRLGVVASVLIIAAAAVYAAVEVGGFH